MTDPVTVEQIKPCPFCGSDKVKPHGPYGWYRQWCISHSCPTFYNGTSEMMKGFPSEAEAIAAWNTRASQKHEPRKADLDWLKIAKLAGEYGVRYQTNARMEAFLAALTLPEQPEDAWTPHDGGGCPVPAEAEVEIRTRGGTQSRFRARAVNWRYGTWIAEIGETMPPECDVVAWRNVTLPEQPRPVDDVERMREAVERFIADYDDCDRADAGIHPLMLAHVHDFRAALGHKDRGGE